MHSIEDIEALARLYGRLARELTKVGTEMDAALTDLAEPWVRQLRCLAPRVAAAREQLEAAIAAAPECFVRPRSLVIDGIKLGLQKQRGKVTFADETATIGRIRRQLPEAQAELLLRVQESVHKPAVYDLSVADLQRLGITVADDSDQPFARVAESEAQKLIAQLLRQYDSGR